MTKRIQRGFTLIEVIIFIVVVGTGLAGILSVINTVVESSADPLITKQTVAIAESLLEEILLKEYANPAGGYSGGSRALFDDVDDYNGYNTTSGIVDLNGTAVAGLSNYNIKGVTVAVTTAAQSAALNAINAKRVTVTVTGPQGDISLTGYRANY